MRDFLSFWWNCVKIAARGNCGFANDWQWLFGIPALAAIVYVLSHWLGEGVVKLLSSDTALGAFVVALVAFVITWIVAFFVRLLDVPVKFHKTSLDYWDTQHILGGMYVGHTFLYAAIGYLVRQYSGKFELERLKDGFDMIPVRAPRNSVVRLGLQFMNSRVEPKYAFYFRDGTGAEVRIAHVYEKQTVRLDEEARFGLKLVCDPTYDLDEHASLTIAVEGWTK